MYATCLHCHSALGRNDTIEAFPVGTRLAFDAAKGRLWVVCPRCSRWNLSPIEERWEAIEECERAFRGTRLRVSTDNIGLAPLRSGLELVRIGKPLRPEFAAWRYGPQLRWRRRRATVAAAIVGTAASVAAAPAVGTILAAHVLMPGAIGIGAMAPLWLPPMVFLLDLRDRWKWERVVARLRSPGGRWLTVRAKHMWGSALYTNDEGTEPALRVMHDGGAQRYEGSDALRASSQLLARANWLGGAGPLVQSAVSRIDAIGDATEFLLTTGRRFTRFRGKRMLAQYRRIGALSLEPVERLALEMAVHEETERRALEGELTKLAEEWRSAEEIAAIADGLFAPDLQRHFGNGPESLPAEA
jgi:hypothetical protein